MYFRIFHSLRYQKLRESKQKQMDLMILMKKKKMLSLKMKKRMKNSKMRHLSHQSRTVQEVVMTPKSDLTMTMMIVAQILQRNRDLLQR